MSNHDKNATMRAELLHRVTNDFIYKAEFSEAQKLQWKMVKNHFDMFRQDMQENVFDAIVEATDLHLTDFVGYYTNREFDYHVVGYLIALRETERWCNTAIANDSETGSPVDLTKFGIELPEYSGPSGGDEPRHKICDHISQTCFDSIVWLVSVLPMGRALSVAVTRMQDVRGWLLDTANFHYNN